jgi:Icc-related predicted phosphoesterase
MKLLLVSDLHTEFQADQGASLVSSLPTGDQVDVCVLAGDITTRSIMEKTLGFFADRYSQVLYVHGNHEFYGSTRAQLLNETQRVVDLHSNLHWLDNSVVELERVRFLGTPMWYVDHPTNARYYSNMGDFLHITGLASWVYQENEKALNFFQREMKEGDVVITHYLPSHRSVLKEFKNSPLNRFFVCEQEPLIRERKPRYWLHGHTHGSFHYQIGETEVVCNPFGVARFGENAKFDWSKVLEI